MAGKNVQQVQTPGAQAAAAPLPASTGQSSPSDDNEALVSGAADLDMPKVGAAPAAAAPELPPDLKAIVAAEVAKALGKQAAVSQAAKSGPQEVPYAEAEKQLAAMTPEERRTARPILTDKGWLTSAEYGAPAVRHNLG